MSLLPALKYRADRDISQAVRELKSFSPSDIARWIQAHRTRVDKATGKRVQETRTPESITLFFKRHPDVLGALKAEIGEEERKAATVSETIFTNGTFELLPSVSNWIRDMTAKGVKAATQKSFLGYVKAVCRGVNIDGWGLKHPDQLSLEDAKEFVFQMKQRKKQSKGYRTALRNFLMSKGIVPSGIAGGADEEAGHYAHMHEPRETIYKVFEWLDGINHEARLASEFSYKTASRLTATLEANSTMVNRQEHTVTVLEKASRGKPKRRFVKWIPDELWKEIGDREGPLFRISAEELNAILKAAYVEILGEEKAATIPMPFHFWRHMFAQHMLRGTKWNLTLVASLGGWTEEALRRYYGEPPEQLVRKWGKEEIPKL